MPHRLDLRLAPVDDQVRIELYVDEQPLRDLVDAFERGRGYSPAGGYVGVVPWTGFDPVSYYLGDEPESWLEPPATPLLGCECGEMGCWPLAAQVAHDDTEVRWSGFSQPHRPRWSYDGFGPFSFEPEQYETAVRRLASELAAGDG